MQGTPCWVRGRALVLPPLGGRSTLAIVQEFPYLTVHERPSLRQGVLVVAFAGWPDAGEDRKSTRLNSSH